MIKLHYPQFWQKKTLVSRLLLPLSLIYFLLGKLRQLVVTPCHLPAKVICIGNATVGGTGKTQVAIWLTGKLIARGLKPIILCKGYGGTFTYPMVVDSGMSAEVTGDEALELCEYATTIISRKPTDAIDLLESLSPDIIIVDDGMQNPGFIKDFIIMVVDGKRGFGNGMLFPAGPMRQSAASSIQKADSIVVTSYIGESDSMVTLSDKACRAIISPQYLPNDSQKYYAFTGIGNPERFFELCKRHLGSLLVGTKAFPDHHKYKADEIKDLQAEAEKLDAKLITTKKDHVKLRSHKGIIPFPKLSSIISLNVNLEIEEGDKLIDSMLDKIIAKNYLGKKLSNEKNI